VIVFSEPVCNEEVEIPVIVVISPAASDRDAIIGHDSSLGEPGKGSITVVQIQEIVDWDSVEGIAVGGE